jgi:hypothetical protein
VTAEGAYICYTHVFYLSFTDNWLDTFEMASERVFLYKVLLQGY